MDFTHRGRVNQNTFLNAVCNVFPRSRTNQNSFIGGQESNSSLRTTIGRRSNEHCAIAIGENDNDVMQRYNLKPYVSNRYLLFQQSYIFSKDNIISMDSSKSLLESGNLQRTNRDENQVHTNMPEMSTIFHSRSRQPVLRSFTFRSSNVLRSLRSFVPYKQLAKHLNSSRKRVAGNLQWEFSSAHFYSGMVVQSSMEQGDEDENYLLQRETEQLEAEAGSIDRMIEIYDDIIHVLKQY